MAHKYERERDAPQYKLNNVCDPKRVRKPHWGDAQLTEQFLYTTICCGCQHVKHLNADAKENAAKNTIRIISVLNAYYGDNVYCVRIKGVLSPCGGRSNQKQKASS